MIGIICAMDAEYDAVKKGFDRFREFVHDGFRFAESVSPRMVLARSQVGKTAAAACVEVMTALYPMIDLLISTGISGALAPQIPIGSVIIGKTVLEYGEGASVRYPLHPIEKLNAGIESFCEQQVIPVFSVTVLSSDAPVFDASCKRQLYQEFRAISVEMESAGICAECWKRGIRVSVVKVISDFAEPCASRQLRSGFIRAFDALTELFSNLIKEEWYGKVGCRHSDS